MNRKVLVSTVAGAALLAGVGAGFYQSQKLPRPFDASPDESVNSSFAHFKFKIHDRPRTLAALDFTDGMGIQHTLHDFSGKLVLLNIWATWCPPCREEMPTLDRLQAKLGGPNFAVVALSIDTGESGVSRVRQFYRETGVKHLPIYIDSTGRSGFELGAVGLPTTLLIDRDGREIGRAVGPANWDTPEVAALIRGQIKNLAIPKSK